MNTLSNGRSTNCPISYQTIITMKRLKHLKILILFAILAVPWSMSYGQSEAPCSPSEADDIDVRFEADNEGNNFDFKLDDSFGARNGELAETDVVEIDFADIAELADGVEAAEAGVLEIDTEVMLDAMAMDVPVIGWIIEGIVASMIVYDAYTAASDWPSLRESFSDATGINSRQLEIYEQISPKILIAEAVYAVGSSVYEQFSVMGSYMSDFVGKTQNETGSLDVFGTLEFMSELYAEIDAAVEQHYTGEKRNFITIADTYHESTVPLIIQQLHLPISDFTAEDGKINTVIVIPAVYGAEEHEGLLNYLNQDLHKDEVTDSPELFFSNSYAFANFEKNTTSTQQEGEIWEVWKHHDDPSSTDDYLEFTGLSFDTYDEADAYTLREDEVLEHFEYGHVENARRKISHSIADVNIHVPSGEADYLSVDITTSYANKVHARIEKSWVDDTYGSEQLRQRGTSIEEADQFNWQSGDVVTTGRLRVFAFNSFGQDDAVVFDYTNRQELAYSWTEVDADNDGVTDGYQIYIDDSQLNLDGFREGLPIHLGVVGYHKVPSGDFPEGVLPESDENLEWIEESILLYAGRLSDYLSIDDFQIADGADHEKHSFPILSTYPMYENHADDADDEATLVFNAGTILEVPTGYKQISSIQMKKMGSPETHIVDMSIGGLDVTAISYGSEFKNDGTVQLAHGFDFKDIEVDIESKQDTTIIDLGPMPFAADDWVEIVVEYADNRSLTRSVVMVVEGGVFEHHAKYKIYTDIEGQNTYLEGSTMDDMDLSSTWTIERFGSDFAIFALMNDNGQILGADTESLEIGVFDWDIENDGLFWVTEIVDENSMIMTNLATEQHLYYDTELNRFGLNSYGGSGLKASKVGQINPAFLDSNKSHIIWNRATREHILSSVDKDFTYGVSELIMGENFNTNGCAEWDIEYIGFGLYNLKNVCTSKYLAPGTEALAILSNNPFGWYVEQLTDGDVRITDPSSKYSLSITDYGFEYSVLRRVESWNDFPDYDIKFDFRIVPTDNPINDFATLERGWYTLPFSFLSENTLMLDPIGNNEYMIMNQDKKVLSVNSDHDITFSRFNNSDDQKWVIYNDNNGVVLYNRLWGKFCYVTNFGTYVHLTDQSPTIFEFNFDSHVYILNNQDYVVYSESEIGVDQYWYTMPSNPGHGLDLMQGQADLVEFESYKFRTQYVGALNYTIHPSSTTDSETDSELSLDVQENGSGNLILNFNSELEESIYWQIESVNPDNTEPFYIKNHSNGLYIKSAIDDGDKPSLTTENGSLETQWRVLNIDPEANSIDIFYREGVESTNLVGGLKFKYEDSDNNSYTGISHKGVNLPQDVIKASQFTLTFEGLLEIPTMDYYEFTLENVGIDESLLDVELRISDEVIIDGSKVLVNGDGHQFLSRKEIPLQPGFHQLQLVYEVNNQTGIVNIPESVVLKWKNDYFGITDVSPKVLMSELTPSVNIEDELDNGAIAWGYDVVDPINHEIFINAINNDGLSEDQMFAELGHSFDEHKLVPNTVSKWTSESINTTQNLFNRNYWYHLKGYVNLLPKMDSIRLTGHEAYKLFIGGDEILSSSLYSSKEAKTPLSMSSDATLAFDLYINSIQHTHDLKLEYYDDKEGWQDLFEMIESEIYPIYYGENLLLIGSTAPDVIPDTEYYRAYYKELDVVLNLDGRYSIRHTGDNNHLLYVAEHQHVLTGPYATANSMGRWTIEKDFSVEGDYPVYQLNFLSEENRHYQLASLREGLLGVGIGYLATTGLNHFFNIESAGDVLVHYTFDEMGQKVRDKTFYGHHGNYQGNTNVVFSDRGNVATFDGNDDYINLGLKLPETEYSVSFWFKTEDANCGMYSAVVSGLGGGGHDRHVYLNNGNINARVWNNETISSNGVNYADGKWHHVVHTLGSSIGGQKLYMDGDLVAVGTKSASDFYWQAEVTIGYAKDAKNWFMNGNIGEFKIWNVALSGSDVITEYSNSNIELPIAYYPLDVDVNDYSGNGHHGINNNVWLGQEIGEDNGTASFSGDNYIDLPVGIMNSNQGSVSLMARTTQSAYGMMFYGTSESTGDGFGGQNELHLGTSGAGCMMFVEGTNSVSGDLYQFSQDIANIDGNWNHFVSTWDANANEIKLYVDGVLIKSHAHGRNTFDFSGLMRLGATHSSSIRQYVGSLDEVKLYDVAISEAEVQMLSKQYGFEPEQIAARTLVSSQESNTLMLEEDAEDYEKFVVYPNPSRDFFNMIVPDHMGNSISVRLFDLSGKVVLEVSEMDLANDRKMSLDVRDVKPGVYTLNLSNRMDREISLGVRVE